LILEDKPAVGVWSDADEQLWLGHAFRQLGFTAHPDYIRFVADSGIVEVWEKHGPPDFCRKKGGSWTCE